MNFLLKFRVIFFVLEVFLICILIVSLVWFRHLWWESVLFALFAFICILLFWQERNRQAAEKTRRRQFDQDYHTFLKIIQSQRHDWMNELQILFGYVRLNKHEQLIAYVDKIKQKLIHESLISKLGIPSLVLFLFSFQANPNAIRLEVELPEQVDLAQAALDDERFSTMIQDFVFGFDEAAVAADGTNLLRLQFISEPRHFKVNFNYQGVYDHSAMERTIRGIRTTYSEWTITKHGNEQPGQSAPVAAYTAEWQAKL